MKKKVNPSMPLITLNDIVAIAALIGIMSNTQTYLKESHIVKKAYSISDEFIREKMERESEMVK